MVKEESINLMNKKFKFHSLQTFSDKASEANIFIHGYSAGHNTEDREKLIGSIPESIEVHTNIFAFWPSSHFTSINSRTRELLAASTRIHWSAFPLVCVADRATHFYKIRSRAEIMGEQLLTQLEDYLSRKHPEINTINLIGHSLGGRLIISCLRKLGETADCKVIINDVLLMAAAVTVEPNEAKQLRSLVKGRILNAYSKADWSLLMNIGETCLGRNQVEHFENVEICGFSHCDYWEKLAEVLIITEFKLSKENPKPYVERLTFTSNNLYHQPTLERHNIMFELNSPSDIYQRINDELNRIIGSIDNKSNNEALGQVQNNARVLLLENQAQLRTQLATLEKSAEWNNFTIAFYGETGAGKSTIIETLRILLQEPSKLASQQLFRELQHKYDLNEESWYKLQQDAKQSDVRLSELDQTLNTAVELHEQKNNDAVNSVEQLKALIEQRKLTATFWQKILYVFRKFPEEKQLIELELLLTSLIAEHNDAITLLTEQKLIATQAKQDLELKLKEAETHTEELNMFADGEIIGDGRADFTRKTHRYTFDFNGQSFVLLDVPGIEGNEGLISEEIEHAVQTAHAVFYVTNQAAPPQTGDEQRKGTLEKIKEHLGAQTEVWTIFNKKITNPKHSLTDRPLTSEDENTSLAGLNTKMREQLGKHYREVFSLTALPAFLASTNHFSPNTQNAKRRNKFLVDFSAENLLDKSRMRDFIQLLSEQLLSGSKQKITKANFHKANDAVNQTVNTLTDIKCKFDELTKSLCVDSNSAKAQLTGSVSSFKIRLGSCGDTLIQQFKSNVQNKMYEIIDNDIGNDEFKQKLKGYIESEQENLIKQLPQKMTVVIKGFQEDVEDILQRFEEQARELSDIYNKFNSIQLNGKFELKLNLDNGIQVGSLLLTFVGAIAAVLGTGGWVLVLGLAGLVFSFAKSIWSAFDSDYKKAQQRKSTDENLRKITAQLSESLKTSLESVHSEMKPQIDLLEQALTAPAEQMKTLLQLLSQSTHQLQTLSTQIENLGSK